MASAVDWIAVTDRLPDDEMTVLIHTQDREVWLGYLDGEQWVEVGSGRVRVTHWAELPEPPA